MKTTETAEEVAAEDLLELIEERAGELNFEHVEEAARLILRLRHQREEEVREAARREMRAVAVRHAAFVGMDPAAFGCPGVTQDGKRRYR